MLFPVMINKVKEEIPEETIEISESNNFQLRNQWYFKERNNVYIFPSQYGSTAGTKDIPNSMKTGSHVTVFRRAFLGFYFARIYYYGARPAAVSDKQFFRIR